MGDLGRLEGQPLAALVPERLSAQGARERLAGGPLEHLARDHEACV